MATAQISSSGTSITSISALATVLVNPISVTWSQQDAFKPVRSGGSLSMSVVATGTVGPTYEWRRNGTPITGATGSLYAIASMSADQVGVYDVVVRPGSSSTGFSSTSSGPPQHPCLALPSLDNWGRLRFAHRPAF